jgi:hypothetical protein
MTPQIPHIRNSHPGRQETPERRELRRTDSCSWNPNWTFRSGLTEASRKLVIRNDISYDYGLQYQELIRWSNPSNCSRLLRHCHTQPTDTSTASR